MLLPSVPRRAGPWPLPVQVAPRYRSLLCAETCLAEGTPPYGKKDLAAYAVDSWLPDAVGAFVDWLIRKSGWTVTESGNPNDRVPIAARHICLLFRRFQNFGEDVTRPYVQALEARRILHMVVGGKSFHTGEEVEALRTALTAIEWPDDELSVYATLRGSFFALTDESLFAYRHQFRRLHPIRLRHEPVATELEAVVKGLALLAELHRKRNSRQVADTIAALMEASHRRRKLGRKRQENPE